MPTDIAAVRAWVGSTPDDDVILDALDDHASVYAAALHLLRVRRADMVATAARFAVSGDYSQDTTANIKALDAQIARLEDLAGVDSSTVATLTSAPICGPSLGR